MRKLSSTFETGIPGDTVALALRAVMKPELLTRALLGCGLAMALSVAGAEARGTFKVLHSFAGGDDDGANPYGGVAPDGQGGFYVATDVGGSSNKGTLTVISKTGVPTVLHSFTGGSDGQNADGTPLKWSVDGNVYGTTQFGGSAGCGTTYQYAPGSGAYTQLYAFPCGAGGAFPFAGPANVRISGEDFLLVTTYNGGFSDDGTIDNVNGNGCDFRGSDVKNPYAGVIQPIAEGDFDTAMAAGGANNLGAVVSASKVDCAITVLHDFAGGSDGATPYGTLLYYNNALYGTTANGGTGTNLGTVFRINPDGSGYSILHVFQGICCGNRDGSFPHSGLTLNRKDGMLYGTTINGGGPTDNGTVYKIDPNTGVEAVVHSFNGRGGAHPYGNLYIKGNTIYGTALQGGANNLGVLFKLRT